jgi:hypothetical protein
MNFLHEVSQLNNEGARLLSSGQPKSSFKHFKAGLQYLKNGCTQFASQQQPDTVLKDSRSCSSRHQVSLRKAVPVPLLNDPKRFYTQMLQQKLSSVPQEYVLKQAFVFQAQGPVTVEKQSLASAVLMYNYALGLHMKGEQHFDRALFLYRQSLQLLTHISDSCADCTDLITAILKNEADIFYRLNDFQSVRLVLDELFLLTQKLAVRKTLSDHLDTIAPSA